MERRKKVGVLQKKKKNQNKKKTTKNPRKKTIYVFVFASQLKGRDTFISPWETRRWLRVAAATAAELSGPAEAGRCETWGGWGAGGGVCGPMPGSGIRRWDQTLISSAGSAEK